MLSPLARVAAVFRQRRKLLGWSQRRVAGQVECSQSYLGQVETGVRPVSRQLAEKLERLLGVSGGLVGVAFLRGRPPLRVETRAVMRQIRQARGMEPSQYLSLGRPQYGRPDRAPGLKSALGWLAGSLGGRDERFWRNLNSIRFDSQAEKHLTRQLAEKSVQLTGVGFDRLGCSLPVMNGSSGRAAGRKAWSAALSAVCVRRGVICGPTSCW
ncbi:helix-turn-helix transcriptional regulator [bacterium]|nr:helix-turn-helix transcriptional regulator [bacterium]